MARLDTICSINMGASPNSSTYNDKGEGLPFYQGNADFGEKHPTPRIWCKAPVKVAHEGDVLISVRAPIGALNVAAEQCCIGRGLAALTANETACDASYLWYGLISKVDELNAKGTGSTFKAISRKALEETEIPLPDIPTQRRIAATLDKVSEGIALCKQMLADLDELVKSQFVEMFGTPESVMNSSHTIAEVADVQVGIVIKPTRYYADGNEGIKAFRSLNIGPMYIKDDDWVYFTEEAMKETQRTVAHTDDILVVRSGSPGTSCVVPLEYDGCNVIDLIIAHPNKEKVLPKYLCAFTNMPHGMNQINSQQRGVAQKHFNVGMYKDLRLILPSLDEQKQFVDFLEQSDKSKFAVQQQLEELETLKKSLMQEYFG